MLEKFKNIRFTRSTLEMISKANEIINDLQGQGYTLTLRQLYYQLVSRDIIPNKLSEYKRLGSILNDARLAGVVDWDAIEDRTRNLQSVAHSDNPSSIISSAAYSFRMDKWIDQPHRVEVWVEKDALIGVLEKACRPLDVPWFSCRGYTSQSELYGASKRLMGYIDAGQEPIVIHLGDHDPSGCDMTRDIFDRLELLCGQPVDVKRIALNKPQIQKYNPPPNPAKQLDSRFKSYISEHGKSCWELDALSPKVIDNLITKTVLDYRDNELYAEQEEIEEGHRAALRKASDHWDKVAKFVKKIK